MAAAEVGVAVGTLRTWRKRRAEAPKAAPVAVADASAPSLSRAERLRGEEDREWGASRQARDQADVLLGQGLAREARDALAAAEGFAARARSLGEAARAEETHETELEDAHGGLLLEKVDAMFAAVGIALPAEVAEHVLRGEEVPEAVAARAREATRRRLRASVEADLRAEHFELRHAESAPERDTEREAAEGQPAPAEDDGRGNGSHEGGPIEPDPQAIREGRQPVIALSEIRTSIRAAYPRVDEAAAAELEQKEREREEKRPRRPRRPHWTSDMTGPAMGWYR